MRSLRYALALVAILLGLLAALLEVWWTAAAMVLLLLSVGLSLRADSRR